MRKLRYIIPLLICLIMGVNINSVNASQGISIYINGEKQLFSNQAVIQNGSTLVPLRGIFEKLGADVTWNQKEQTIDATKGNAKIWLKIGSKNAKVSGNAVNLSVQAQVKSGKTLVPLRFISESLGANVEWNQKNQMVTIIDKLPTLNVGETYSDKEIEVTIKKLEYVQDGFKVFLSVINKSEKPLKNTGGLFFKLNDVKYEEELNRSGYSRYLNSNGYIYKGETREGYYQWYFEKDIKIKEIEFNTGIVNNPKAKWIVE